MKMVFGITVTVLILALVEPVSAEQMKCIVAGKTIYTDNPARCTKGVIKPINGSMVITTFPKEVASKNTAISPPLETPSLLDSVLQHFGLSQKDIADGGKTVMDARKRGSWQAPEIPDDDK